MYRRNFPNDPGYSESINVARVAHFRQEGSFRRSVNSNLPACIGGLALLIAGILLLFWNEGRAVSVDRALSEGLDRVTSLPAEVVLSKHDGDLVHISGSIIADSTQHDPAFGLSVKAVQLKRVVQMYQWVERDTQDEERAKEYSLEWRSELIDSSKFEAGAAKRNPVSMPYKSMLYAADTCSLGVFKLDSAFVNQMEADKRLDDADKRLPLQSLAERGFAWHEGTLYWPLSASWHPQVGDLRIRWLTGGMSGDPYSAIGQQTSSGHLRPYTSGKEELALISRGYHPAGRLFGRQILHNRILTWTVRACGWLLLFLALLLTTPVLESLVAMAPTPLRRSLAPLAPLTLCTCVSGSISLAAIAAAWLCYRPLIGCAVVAFSLLPLLLPRLAQPFDASSAAASLLPNSNFPAAAAASSRGVYRSNL